MNNPLNRTLAVLLITFGLLVGTAAMATVGSANPDLIAIG